MFIIGTTGHIDHGKSSLIKALTSIDPDRLPEEKKRGMTIDIGFAWMPLSNGETVGFIDVPGHKDLMKNVIAGLWGVNASLLVIAADDGWMPQTQEHLRILDYFNINHAIVVLTKIDAVTDPDWLKLVEEDVRTRLESTCLKGSPIIKVSAQQGTNMEELRKAIEELLKRAKQHADIGKPRLYIDRVFTITGSGTVVTGTLVDGCVSLDQKIVIYPGNDEGRIRTIESYKQHVDKGLPGSRVALNLAGLKKDDLERGDIVYDKPENLVSSQWLDVSLNLVAGTNWPLKDKTDVLVYLGTREATATVKLINNKVLNPGTTAYAQLQFKQPQSCRIGDRFVMRRPSPALTIGGGVILDPSAEKFRIRDKAALHGRLEQRSTLELEALVRSELDKHGFVLRDGVLNASHFTRQEIEQTIKELKDKKALIISSQWLVDAGVLERKRTQLLDLLSRYHEINPMSNGISTAELMSQLNLTREILDSIIKQLTGSGEIKINDNFVSLIDFKPNVTNDQEFTIARVLQVFEQYPKSPPRKKELEELVPGSDGVIAYMCRNNMLVSCEDDVLFEKNQYENLKNRVIEMIRKSGSISIQEARDTFGLTRKYIIPLFTRLDGEGITAKKDNERVFSRAFLEKQGDA